MTSFLLRFGAIESRIASISCPRGTNGRLHALRLRSCFRNYSRVQQATAIEERQSVALAEPLYESNGETRGNHDGYIAEGAAEENDGRPLRLGSRKPQEARGISLQENVKIRKQLSRNSRIWGWNMGAGSHSMLPNVGEQDVLPVQFPDGTRVECSANENELYQALRIGNPHNVLKALMSLVRFDGLDYYSKILQTIPSNTFSEILRCLDPQHFVSRYGRFHKEISQTYAQVMGLPSVTRSGYHRFNTIFLSQIHGTIKARQRDQPLSLSDYRYLLKCARLTGNIKASQDIWMSMTAVATSGQRSPVTPDGECFNHYLATMTLSDSTSPHLKNRLRVIPDNFIPRSWPMPPYTLRGHRAGPDNGIKANVSQIFRQMVKAGVPGDEETFCLMMMGFAREGDTVSVGSTLRRVWSVDVDALISADESGIQPVKPYALDSPFYPSAKILHTISHAYGINNDVPTALRVVDYVSRQYNIRIPTSVWNELLEWTFVLSKRRYGGRVKDDGTSIGQLPREAMSNIWATMTSAPYYVVPTMEMYDRYVRNLLHRQRYGEARTVMSAARALHIRHVHTLSRQHIILKSTLQPGHPVSENRMRDLQFSRMRVMRNREYIKRWIRLLIAGASFQLKYHPNWSARDLPDLLREWKLFIPKRVEYPIATGRVRFYSDVVTDNGAQQRKWRVGYMLRQQRFRRLVGRGLKEERDVRGSIRRWERRHLIAERDS
jgi:hypothetical protein